MSKKLSVEMRAIEKFNPSPLEVRMKVLEARNA